MRRPIARVLTAGVLLIATVAAAGGAALAAPPKVPSFGPAIDAYARYEGQRQCLTVEQPGVRDFRNLVLTAYPGTRNGGILRACHIGGTSEHKEGRAWDWMVNASNAKEKAAADELVEWLLATDRHGNRHALARRFGVMYIVWNHRVWKAYQPDRGWQPYTGANPHTDHVHFSFSWDGALRRTSYWTGASGVAQTPFRDVPATAYYAAPVAWMVDHAITTGHTSTEFRPHAGVTRAQMAAFLWRLMDEPTGFPPHGFPDVPRGSYYDDAVRWLKASGITAGYGPSGDRYEPHRTVTRGQMASFLWRTVGRPAGDPRHGFPDVARNAHYDGAVSWLEANGITQGDTSGRFRPGDPVTRAHTAAFLHRMAGNPAAWRAASSVPGSVLFP